MTERFATMIVQLIGIPALLALCAWLAFSVNSLQIQVATLNTQVMERTGDIYTNSSAAQDRQFVALQIQALDQRVTRLETAPKKPLKR